MKLAGNVALFLVFVLLNPVLFFNRGNFPTNNLIRSMSILCLVFKYDIADQLIYPPIPKKTSGIVFYFRQLTFDEIQKSAWQSTSKTTRISGALHFFAPDRAT